MTYLLRRFDDPTLPGLVATLKGHTDPVNAITFTPDGSQVVTGSFDRTLRLWDAATGKEVKVFGGQGGHQNQVLCLALSPDGKTLASGGSDNSAKLWNMQPQDNDPATQAGKAAPEKPIRSLGHPNIVDAVAFNTAGTQLATGSHDGAVRLWDVEKGQQLRQINAHTQPAPASVYAVAWDREGKNLLSASFDGNMKLWEADSGRLIREFKAYKTKDFEQGHRDSVYCASFSPDGTTIASGSARPGVIKIWNVADGTVVRDLTNPSLKIDPLTSASPSHPGDIFALYFAADGSQLISVGGAPLPRGHLAIWNIADGKLLLSHDWPIGAIRCLALSPDGKHLAFGTAAGTTPRPNAGTNHGYILTMPDAMK